MGFETVQILLSRPTVQSRLDRGPVLQTLANGLRCTAWINSLLKNGFVGESAAKSVRSKSRIAGLFEDMTRLGDAKLTNFDRSLPE